MTVALRTQASRDSRLRSDRTLTRVPVTGRHSFPLARSSDDSSSRAWEQIEIRKRAFNRDISFPAKDGIPIVGTIPRFMLPPTLVLARRIRTEAVRQRRRLVF